MFLFFRQDTAKLLVSEPTRGDALLDLLFTNRKGAVLDRVNTQW